jgi:FMN-dependent oxidoreductase (nitrilotriacetate monooxygenase family)
MTNRQLHLNAFLMGVGHHEAAWRHPDTDPTAVTSLTHFTHLARTAERGRLDSVFLADTLALGEVAYNAVGTFEPLTLLSAIAAVTEHIGLIATVSTTYNEPFTVARTFASLDHLSGGRAGWNIVTSANAAEAANFGLDVHPDHADRYARAREHVDVTLALWDSWASDAVLADKAAGRYADPDRIRRIDHAGPSFRVGGPLNIPRPPQGRPLLVQAGSSDVGKDLGARFADAVFTAQPTLADGKAFYADLKRRVAGHGRDPEGVKILPGIAPVIGATETEARRLEAELDDLTVAAYGLAQLGWILQIELTEADLDRPLPPVQRPERFNGHQSRFDLVVDLARREDLTVRQLIRRLAGGRGHRVVAGTPEQIADQIEEWFTADAADGFNVMPPRLPAGLDDFVDHVVPLLQRRGLFRTEYEPGTLRDRYGVGADADHPTDALSTGLHGLNAGTGGRA